MLSVLIVLGIIGGFGSAVNADDLYFIKQPFSGSCDYSEPYKVTWAISGECDWVSVERKGADSVWYSGVDLDNKSYAEIKYLPTTGPSVYRIAAGNNHKIIHSEEFSINWTGKDPYSFWTQPSSGSATKKSGYDIEWSLGEKPDLIILSRYEKSNKSWSRVAELTSLKKYNISYNSMQSDTFRLAAYYSKYGYYAYSNEFTVNWTDHIHSVTVISGIADKSQAKENEIVHLKADASPAGKEFDKWVVASGNVSIIDATSSTAYFSMPNENVSVKATYKDILYDLVVDYDSSMVNVNGIFSIKTSCYGDQYSFSVTPNIGYKVISVKANGEELKQSADGYTVTQPAGKLVVSIKAEPLATNGWVQSGNKWCYFESGKLVTGWKQISGIWYYMDPKGVMVTGWKLIDCEWYYFETSGRMITGWKQIEDKWYYMDDSGHMSTGWVRSGNSWFYLDYDGIMLTGWQQIDGIWYYLESSGQMKTGWLKKYNTWYYLSSSGAMVTGWEKISGIWYYFENNGSMLANTSKTIDGKTYYFDATGRCTNP